MQYMYDKNKKRKGKIFMIYYKKSLIYFSKNIFLEVNFHLDFTTSYYLFYENSSNKISNTLTIF